MLPNRKQLKRRAFYKQEEIVKNVEKKVREADTRGEPINYIMLVSDGEHTLDIHLGAEIKLLDEEKLVEVDHRENKFYLRKFQHRKARHS